MSETPQGGRFPQKSGPYTGPIGPGQIPARPFPQGHGSQENRQTPMGQPGPGKPPAQTSWGSPVNAQVPTPFPDSQGLTARPAMETIPGSSPFGPQAQASQASGSSQPTPQPPAKRGLLRRMRDRYRGFSRRRKIVLLVLLLCLLLPMLLTIIEGINTYTIYNQARNGLNHLNEVQKIMAEKDPKTGSTAIFELEKLSRVQQEVDAAHTDFKQVNDRLQNDALVGLLAGMLPEQIATARGLSAIGVEGMEIAQQAVKSAQVITPSLPDPTLKDETKPLATPEMMTQARVLVDFALPRVKTMIDASKGIKLDSLPLSDSQRGTLQKALTLLPEVVDEMEMGRDFLANNALDWLIGVDKPRNFLVQTLDRGELRSTGGFTGQLGVISLNGGRMSPFDLKSVGLYEKTAAEGDKHFVTHPIFLEKIQGNSPPETFDWWPIPNFGLRDSNVSADFPTSAKLALDIYNNIYHPIAPNNEFPNKADGLIVFSPFLIAQILRVTGPIVLEKYNEEVTADNLEEKIHYYQLNNAGTEKAIRAENLKVDEMSKEEARKLFTKRIAEALMNRVKSLSPENIINLLPMMLYAMKTRDLQVYLENPQAQELIKKYGSDASMDRSTDKDGVFIVQSNVSVSKASQYVRTYVKDTVTLDDKGGATHVMTMTLAYTQIGQVYGLDTYYDYLRVYVPPESTLLWGYGFAQFQEPHLQCGTEFAPDRRILEYKPCEQDVLGNGAMICPPDSNTSKFPQFRSETPDGDLSRLIALDKVGSPTNLISDEPGRNMFGGWVEVLKNCNMTVSLSWYVPNVAKDAPYELLFQRQGGTFPIVDLTVQPTPGNCQQFNTGGFYYNGVLGGEDKLFQLSAGDKEGKKKECYPQMRV